MTATIRIADLAPSPGGRFVADGQFSGEWFRDEYLAPALKNAIANSERLVVVLDGTSGYGSSFLEEAFGGLIRRGMFTPRAAREWLIVKANSPLYSPYKILADKYISSARPETVAA